MTEPLSQKDIPRIAEIHKKYLPSFLSHFPLTFIEKFYEFQLKREGQILLGVKEKGKISGFVFGTDNVDLLYERFIEENKFYFFSNTLRALLAHPRYIILFAAKFFTASYASECKRQLVYIAVDQSLPPQGTGSTLVSALEKAWSNEAYYELEVEGKNTALAFYTKKGFFVVHKYNNWVEEKYLLRKNL